MKRSQALALSVAYVSLVRLRDGEHVHGMRIEALVRRGLLWRTRVKVQIPPERRTERQRQRVCGLRVTQRSTFRWQKIYHLTADGREIVRIVDAAIFYARGKDTGLTDLRSFHERPIATLAVHA